MFKEYYHLLYIYDYNLGLCPIVGLEKLNWLIDIYGFRS